MKETLLKIFFVSLIAFFPGVSLAVDTPLITTTTLGTLRNDYDGYIGTKFTTNKVFQVNQLCRYKNTGNSQSHFVKLYRASDYNLVASATVDLNTGTVGTYVCANVTPVSLENATAYYLLSNVATGGDQWGTDTTSTTPDSLYTNTTRSQYCTTVPDSCTDGTTLDGTSYIPLNLMIDVPSVTSSTPEATTTPDGTGHVIFYGFLIFVITAGGVIWLIYQHK